MKKYRSVALLTALTLIVSLFSVLTVSAAGEPGFVYDFYYKDQYDSYLVTGVGGCNVSWENNGLKMTCDGSSSIGDMFFYVNEIAEADMEASDYPYIAVNLMNPSDASEFEAHFSTSLHSISGSTVFHFDIDTEMTEYKTFICNIPEQNVINVNRINGPDGICAELGSTANIVPEMEEGGSFWEGSVTQFRIDGTYRGGASGESIEGDTLYIGWIAFFETKEAAENYAGPDHSVVKTPAPTEAATIDTVPGGYILFNEESDAGDMLFTTNIKNQISDIYFDDAKGCYVISIMAGGDPFAEMGFSSLIAMDEMDEVSADDYKVMQLGIKVDVKAGAKSGSIYFGTDEHPGYSEPQNVVYNYVESEDMQIVNVDFSKNRTWEGTVANCRLDAFTTCNEDTDVELYYIAFFRNLQSAEAFAAQYAEKGFDAFPAPPTKAPTKEPTATPVPTEVPAATAVSEATAVPEATDAPDPGDDQNGNAEKGKFPVVPVVIIGAVAVAAVVAGIIIANSKKKKG